MGVIAWLDDLTAADVAVAGGKGANLGELVHAGLPVPRGFVVTTEAFLAALEAAGVRDKLRALVTDLPVGDDAALRRAAEEAAGLLGGVAVPPEVARELLAAYDWLGPDVLVAVRSSGTAEDSGTTSFAGMNATFTSIAGHQDLLARLLDCWASLYSPRSLAYRADAAAAEEPTIAVIVQAMIPSQRSGIMFTVDPATEDRDTIVIEAVLGQGEAVVSGMVEPDTYRVAKAPLAVTDARLGMQDREIVRGADGVEREVPLDAGAGGARVLEDEQILAIARLGLAVERHYGTAQDIEWALADEAVWLVQTRPVTTLDHGGATRGGSDTRRAGEQLLSGLGASRGRASGPVRVLHTPDEGVQLAAGEVLVAPMTSPDWLPAMRRAAALVTDEGGMTCHAAIVSREIGLPCVVGTRKATTTLRDGQVVTVDGDRGEIRAGQARAVPYAGELLAPRAQGGQPMPHGVGEPLATRIYVNLAVPDRAEQAAAHAVDGVGLLRAELMVAAALNGVHPRLLIERGRRQDFVDAMADGLRTITAAFPDRPVVYRSIDFRTNEFRGLEGGDRFEPAEANPMIGYRGCFRYVDQPDLFELELDVLAAVAEQAPGLTLMIPFVRTAWELEECLRLVRAHPRANRAAGVGDGRGALGGLLDPHLRAAGRDRCLDRQQRPDPAGARRGPGLGRVRGAVRRGRPRRPRRHRPDRHRLPGQRAHLLAVRPGAVEPAGLRRAPRPARHHLDLGRTRRRRGGSQPGRRGRAADPARGRGTRAPGRHTLRARHHRLGAGAPASSGHGAGRWTDGEDRPDRTAVGAGAARGLRRHRGRDRGPRRGPAQRRPRRRPVHASGSPPARCGAATSTRRRCRP